MKRISALFTTVAVILSLFSSAAATKESKGITGVEFAQLFIDNCYNDVNDLTTNETIQARLIVGESINIYNENDELIGFCMDLQRDQQPSGYIVLKFTDKGPMIEEFVTEIGALNLYNNIVEKSKLAVQTADKKLYGFGPMEYYVPVQEQGETIYTDYATQKYTQTEFNIIKQNYGKQAARLKNRTLDDWIDEYNQKNAKLNQASIAEDTFSNDASSLQDGKLSDSLLKELELEYKKTYNVIAASGGIADGYDVITDTRSDKYIRSSHLHLNEFYTIYDEPTVELSTGKYACSVSAMLNCVSYYKDVIHCDNLFVNNSLSDTYQKLWNDSKTKLSETRWVNGRNVDYGITAISDLGPGLAKYFQDRGYSLSHNGYLLTLWSDYTRDIWKEKGCFFSYTAANDFSHTVFVTGYIETSDTNYLYVADGWHNYHRYLFNANFGSKGGFSVTVG